jgi:uncharacterized protein YukJ
MPLKQYGVLKGRPIATKLGAGSSPHYQVHIIDETTDYRIAINVKSSQSPPDLLYLMNERFEHPVFTDLRLLPAGFTPLPSTPGGLAVDFIRGNFFDPRDMRPLPGTVPGPDNDLNERLDAVLQRALADEEALVYAFGERWGPEENKKDAYFGFLPGNGIHDIHMNQGNDKQFEQDNGVWQDGAVLVQFPASDETPEQWVAVFLAFQSQSWHTDDTTGFPTGTAPGGEQPGPGPVTDDAIVQIVAALVNPTGPAPEHETVTILNTSNAAIDLQGWAIANKDKKRLTLTGSIAAGATRVIDMSADVPLSNQGGIITLLDKSGLKVHGVAYTKGQASKEGWTIPF